MSLLSYIAAQEKRMFTPKYDYSYWPKIEFYTNYPCGSPVIQKQIITTNVGHSPYADATTKTWWQYNDTTKEYEDTGISVYTDATTVENLLSDVNISTFQNDANYATSDEDAPLTIEEVNAILQ